MGGTAHKQIVVDYFGCNGAKIKDPSFLKELFDSLCERFALSTVKAMNHHFGRGEYTWVCILKESHLLMHSWPEIDFLTVDFYCCKPDINMEEFVSYVGSQVGAKEWKAYPLKREIHVAQNSQVPV